MNFLFVILSGYYPIPVTSCASQAPLNYYWGAEMRTYVLQRFFFFFFFAGGRCCLLVGVDVRRNRTARTLLVFQAIG